MYFQSHTHTYTHTHTLEFRSQRHNYLNAPGVLAQVNAPDIEFGQKAVFPTVQQILNSAQVFGLDEVHASKTESFRCVYVY